MVRVDAALRFVVLVSLGVAPAQDAGTPAQQALRQGKQLFLAGDYAAATTALRRALARLENPADRVDARLTLASIYQAQGNDDRAIIEFQWAIAEDPPLELDPVLYSPKTVRLFQEARHGGIDRFLSARESYLKGQLAEALEQFELARRLLRTQGSPADLNFVLEALLSSALIHQQLRSLPECEQAFREALALDPELDLDPDVYSPSTIEIFQQVHEELVAMQGAQSARTMYVSVRTRAEEAAAETDDATGSFAKALELASNAERMWARGDYAAAQRSFEEAALVLEEAWPKSAAEEAGVSEDTVSLEGPGAAPGVPGGVAGPPPPESTETGALTRPAPVRIPANSRHAFPIERENPVYPTFAVRARVEGVVSLDVLVDEEGKPESVRAVSSPTIFESAAEEAVRRWRWRAYVVDGKPVPIRVLVTVRFQLAER